MEDERAPVRVAIPTFREATASTVYGIYDLLLSAGRDWGFVTAGSPGPALFAPIVVAATRSPFVAANGVTISPGASFSDVAIPDVVCIPEILVPPGERLSGRFDDAIEWLRNCYDNGATVTTACSGALLLAEAGLLAGRDATTHWAYCDILARYPGVRVHPQRALVVSGEGQRLVMAGGGTSWLDVSLWLIARYAGAEAAMQTARLNLIAWHEIGQQPFARLARTVQVDDRTIADCQTWIADHYREPSPVAAMVRRSGLPERSFKRRFRLATGMAPLEYVHTLRLEEAKQMLETTDEPIETIANEVGYEDAAFFSRLFRRNVGLTPGEYRRRFGGMRRALGAADSRPQSAPPAIGLRDTPLAAPLRGGA